VSATPDDDPARDAYIRRAIRRNLDRIPALYHPAQATDPRVIAWCDEVIAAYSRQSLDPMPKPLLLLGPTGTGKTWQAYGAVKRVSIGALRADPAVLVKWEATNVPDLLARLRPSATPDPEGEFERFAGTPLLLLDDIAAQRDTGWTDEIMYRLLDRRSSWMRPGIYVSNLPFSADDGETSLESVFSDSRVISRLAECRRIAIKGDDRRSGGES
jgi:DNA replication protein DnaC